MPHKLLAPVLADEVFDILPFLDLYLVIANEELVDNLHDLDEIDIGGLGILLLVLAY